MEPKGPKKKWQWQIAIRWLDSAKEQKKLNLQKELLREIAAKKCRQEKGTLFFLFCFVFLICYNFGPELF